MKNLKDLQELLNTCDADKILSYYQSESRKRSKLASRDAAMHSDQALTPKSFIDFAFRRILDFSPRFSD